MIMQARMTNPVFVVPEALKPRRIEIGSGSPKAVANDSQEAVKAA